MFSSLLISLILYKGSTWQVLGMCLPGISKRGITTVNSIKPLTTLDPNYITGFTLFFFESMIQKKISGGVFCGFSC